MMGRCSLFAPNMVGIFPPLLWFLGYSKPEIPLRFFAVFGLSEGDNLGLI